MAKKIGKKLKKFSLKTRLKSVDEFKAKTLKMFKDYIKCIVVWGSITRGDYTGKSDVDIYIIFDDTKFSLKKFDEIRSKINNDIYKIAASIDPRLHPQPIIAITEFIKGIRYTHPLFFNIIREGYAVYDTGFFIPMRKLLEWGEFPVTSEAAHMRMNTVPKRIQRVKNVKLYIIAEDLYYAMLDAAQAIIMFVGFGPPVPKLAAKEVRKHLVKTGLLEEEYAQMLEDIVIFRKKVEYKELKDISGEEVDKWIEKTKRYVERFEKLLNDLETQKKAFDVKRSYEVMVKASVAALKSINKLPEKSEKLPDAFKKYLAEPGLINPFYSGVFDKVVEMRKKVEDGKLDKLSEREIYMNKEYVRRFIIDVKRLVKTPLAIDDIKGPEKIPKAGKKTRKKKRTKKKP